MAPAPAAFSIRPVLNAPWRLAFRPRGAVSRAGRSLPTSIVAASLRLEPILEVIAVLAPSCFVSLVRRSCDAIRVTLFNPLLLLAVSPSLRLLNRRVISRALRHANLLRLADA